jgi:hypothetical protein
MAGCLTWRRWWAPTRLSRPAAPGLTACPLAARPPHRYPPTAQGTPWHTSSHRKAGAFLWGGSEARRAPQRACLWICWAATCAAVLSPAARSWSSLAARVQPPFWQLMRTAGSAATELRLRSPAGCAAPCPVEPRTQLACGGPRRGACNLGGRSHSGAIVAVCDCAPGVSGPSCSQGGTAPPLQASTADEGSLPPMLLPLACLSCMLLAARLCCQRAAAPPLPFRRVLADSGWPLLQIAPASLLCAFFLFVLWGSTPLGVNQRLQRLPPPEILDRAVAAPPCTLSAGRANPLYPIRSVVPELAEGYCKEETDVWCVMPL